MLLSKVGKSDRPDAGDWCMPQHIRQAALLEWVGLKELQLDSSLGQE